MGNINCLYLSMPIFMDLHVVPGITAKMAAEAHFEDHKWEKNFGCKCLTYWVDEDKNRAFCLIDAPNKEAINKMHNKAYGGQPEVIIEVDNDVVKAFLGRNIDPKTLLDLSSPNLKIFNDPAFRVILVAEMLDKVLLQVRVGKKRANQLFTLFQKVLKEQIKKQYGSQAISNEETIIASFTSTSAAVRCSLAVQKELHEELKDLNLRLILHAGLPVTQNGEIFGEVVNFGKFLSSMTWTNEIISSPIIHELYRKEFQKVMDNISNFRSLNSAEEKFLEALLKILSDNWNNSKFTIKEFNTELGMSKSQFYRRSLQSTGKSPSALLLEFRLLKSLQFLKRAEYNISQSAFDSGFSSPSYFTKCFVKRFDMKPTEYKVEFIS